MDSQHLVCNEKTKPGSFKFFTMAMALTTVQGSAWNVHDRPYIHAMELH
jgi:hypothetical protein